MEPTTAARSAQVVSASHVGDPASPHRAKRLSPRFFGLREPPARPDWVERDEPCDIRGLNLSDHFRRCGIYANNAHKRELLAALCFDARSSRYEPGRLGYACARQGNYAKRAARSKRTAYNYTKSFRDDGYVFAVDRQGTHAWFINWRKLRLDAESYQTFSAGFADRSGNNCRSYSLEDLTQPSRAELEIAPSSSGTNSQKADPRTPAPRTEIHARAPAAPPPDSASSNSVSESVAPEPQTIETRVRPASTATPARTTTTAAAPTARDATTPPIGTESWALTPAELADPVFDPHMAEVRDHFARLDLDALDAELPPPAPKAPSRPPTQRPGPRKVRRPFALPDALAARLARLSHGPEAIEVLRQQHRKHDFAPDELARIVERTVAYGPKDPRRYLHSPIRDVIDARDRAAEQAARFGYLVPVDKLSPDQLEVEERELLDLRAGTSDVDKLRMIATRLAEVRALLPPRPEPPPRQLRGRAFVPRHQSNAAAKFLEMARQLDPGGSQ